MKKRGSEKDGRMIDLCNLFFFFCLVLSGWGEYLEENFWLGRRKENFLLLLCFLLHAYQLYVGEVREIFLVIKECNMIICDGGWSFMAGFEKFDTEPLFNLLLILTNRVGERKLHLFFFFVQGLLVSGLLALFIWKMESDKRTRVYFLFVFGTWAMGLWGSICSASDHCVSNLSLQVVYI
ncbi:MAG: hypothetical protein ACLTW9_12090 [Enterocloster sp.]